MFPEFRTEIFFGWLGPAIAWLGSTFMTIRAAKKDPHSVTKSLQIGFLIKLIYYGAFIIVIFQLYGFEPVPFMCSFSGFFLGLHALEAIIIKNLNT